VTTQAIEIPGYIAGTWDIDPVHSHIGFVARHLMLSKVRGRFDRFEGQIVTGEDPVKSAAAVIVDMNSVNTGNEVRDDDLRSGNFFDAANYPTMTYRSTGIRQAGQDLFLDGQLTVRGMTKPVSLRFEVNGFAVDPEGVTRASFSAAGEVNRIDFGVCTNPPIGGLASEKVHLDIEAGAVLRGRRG
jgi:polyisoprenoid-binding protein YceI